MIITRTPFRISFAGGGSDFPDFYKEELGAVISTTINKYIYLSMHELFNQSGYFLKYSENEWVTNVEDIRHPIIREVFMQHMVTGVDFNSSSDIPAGTGLGSSSSFTVGLINLCHTYKHVYRSREHIAKEACQIEIDKLQSPIGKQDQYAAAIGGLNFIQFNSDESVLIEKIPLSQSKLSDLEQALILVYLGKERLAKSILQTQKLNVEKNRPMLRKMVQLAKNLRDELVKGNIENLGPILHDNWNYKKELAPDITNDRIEYYYQKALSHGATGGKLLGAGGTGFLLLVAPREERNSILNFLGLDYMPFKLENSGTMVIYG